VRFLQNRQPQRHLPRLISFLTSVSFCISIRDIYMRIPEDSRTARDCRPSASSTCKEEEGSVLETQRLRPTRFRRVPGPCRVYLP